MAAIELPYLVRDRDRHGNVRYYVRVPGQKKVRLRGEPGSEAFMAQYHAARSGAADDKTRAAARPGSFRWLCQAYFGSHQFKALDASTKSWRRRALESACQKHGDKPVRLMESRHVRKLRDELADKPGAANQRLKAMKALFAWGVIEEPDIVKNNPTRDVKLIRYKSDGHHTWTLEEVATFEEKYPIGTKARLAMALLLYTACRREDVVRLGRQHIRGGRIKFVQAKNEHRKPVEIDIPVHPDLAAAIAGADAGNLTFLITDYGKPFTVAGFGNRFREWCNAAGLPHCSAHGLRKATAARLAERGATPHEIMSITGHRSLDEVERYTRAAQQAKLADRAMGKL